MEYFVVYLKCKRYFALPKYWIENPVLGQKSKVFICDDTSALPDFTCEKKFYVNQKESACYDAFVLKSFDSYEAAQNFASNKRLVPPVQYKSLEIFDFHETEPVDFIDISDSDTSDVRLYRTLFIIPLD